MNSFIPWVGGKSKLLWIINKMAPDHYSRFIDVFGGSGTVTMSRPIQQGCMEVYNDFNSNLTNLFCCVKNRPLPGYDRLLSAQCAPDAGFLAVVQRHAGTAWRSASLELDTEHCDHGGRAARRGAPLVHPAGYSTESIQGGASANDRGFCVSGKCSRRKGRCVV